MIRTLACLAGAMTATTAFLGWISPSPVQTKHLPSWEELVGRAREAVESHNGINPRNWEEVELVVEPATPSRGSLLAAMSTPADCHFRIDRNGIPMRSEGWLAQKRFSESPRTIRVQIVGSDARDSISPIQWQGIRSLVAMLGEKLVPPGASLPVRLQRRLYQAYGIEPKAVVHFPPLPTQFN